MSEVTELFPPHPAQAALGVLTGAVGDLAAVNLWSMSEAELLDLRIDLEQVRARLDAVVLATTREVDARGAATATGAPSTAAWLRARLRVHPGAAKAEVALAADLDGPLTSTGAALAAGDISAEQARAVATGVHGLPRAVATEVVRRAEQFLLDQAATFDPAALHKLGRHLILVLDPERGAALEKEEAAQADRQQLTLGHDPDGTRPIRGRFTAEAGALLDAALSPLAKPRRREDGTPDPRSPGQRRAEALLELITLALHAPEMPEHGGEPVTLTVTTTRDYLQSTTGDGPADHPTGGPPVPAAVLEDGTPLSPETTRRLACDAWLVAAITTTGGEVLDIGRLSRVVPRPIRRALITRDTGCAFPGCGRPPRWCHAHHLWHWALGGPTALRNLALLCGHHHHVVHHNGWTIHLGDDGHPWFTPPPWIDPSQTPRPPWRPPELTRLE